MGEIIKFDFNKNKREEIKQDETTEKWWGKEKSPAMFIRFAKFLVSEEAKKIKNLPATAEAYSQAEQLVKNYTTPELMGWIENSSESDWKVKPSFFKAIINELKIRANDKNQWVEKNN